MKKKVATTVCILCTSTLVFASDLKVLKKGNTTYIPLNKVIQNLGGKIQKTKDKIDIKINGENIEISEKTSFAKIGKQYYPLNQKQLNGFNVPVDTKLLLEDNEMYIAQGFLKDNNLADYTISKDKIIINGHEKTVLNIDKNNPKTDEKKEEIDNQTTQDTDQEDNNQKTEKPQETEKPSRPARPNRPTRPVLPTTPTRPTPEDNNEDTSSDNGNNSTPDNNDDVNNGNGNNSESGSDNSTNTDNTAGENQGDTNSNPVKPNNPDTIDNHIE